MILRVIPASEIEAGWEWLAQLLAPAVAQDRKVTLETVKAKLLNGQCGVIAVSAGKAAGVLVLEINDIDGKMVCWASYIAGVVAEHPKGWLRTMRAIMDELIGHARSAGCSEIRIGGRDWSRVFPGFEFIDRDINNDMRRGI